MSADSDDAGGGSVRLQPDPSEKAVIEYLRSRGASFFGPLHEAVGGGYPAETVGALWSLVWQGVVTNDTFHAMRAFTRESAASKRPRRAAPKMLRSRRLTLPSAEGRGASFTLSEREHAGRTKAEAATRWAAAIAQQLLARHSVLTREAAMAESLPGGFGTGLPGPEGDGGERPSAPRLLCRRTGCDAVCAARRARPVRSLRDGHRSERDETGRSRIVAPRCHGSGESLWGDIEMARLPPHSRLRRGRPHPPHRGSARQAPSAASAASAEQDQVAASSPASLEASAPSSSRPGTDAERGRDGGPRHGALAAYLARGNRQLMTWLPEAEPERSRTAPCRGAL